MLFGGDAISCIPFNAADHHTERIAPSEGVWPQVGLAKPTFYQRLSRMNVSCANFFVAAVLMYMGTMS